MQDDYKHLVIEREPLRNDRRTRIYKIPPTVRGDLRSHGQHLFGNLDRSLQLAREQETSIPGSYVLKLNYTGILDFSNLSKHGVEFISQEGDKLCVVFGNETGLEIFSDHLQRLGINEEDLTYKQILEALEGIDNWTPEDRMSWAVKHKGFPNDEHFYLDVEIWPIQVAHHPERNQLCEGFEHWLNEREINLLDKVNLDSLIMYRLQVSLEQAGLILNHKDVRLVDLVPATGISYQQLNREIDEGERDIQSPSENAARICILDSGINTNHPLLSPAIAESASFIDDKDEFDEEGHGTAVASIALYGDLEACNSGNFWRPEIWLYNGKILDGDGNFDKHTIENKITDSVEYFVELGCRIFNLSLGNSNAPYDGKHIRGIAYVLDSLARKYDVLFVVSAGNFSGSENPLIPNESWRDEYPEYLLCEQSVIIDPAPALNVLTVGSLAQHNATVDAQRYPEISQLSPASKNQPSPFTCHGPSVKGAFKPELVATGGNLASPMRLQGGQWRTEMRGLGVLSCHHEFVGNTLFKEISGTSFAAPYITHLAGRLLNEYPDASANLLRAMLVNHGNILDETKSTFSEDMKNRYKKAKETKHREIERDVAGYGVVDEDALYRSSENIVVLMAEESIENNSHQFFELPLPEEYLRSAIAARELRISLAFTPAVRTTRLDYIATRISYRLVKGESLAEVEKHFNHDSQDETDTRNDDATGNRCITSQQRDKGTVQSSTWKFRSRKPNEKWFVVVTRQDRDWGEAISMEQERYALVVTVTDRENEQAQLYTQIRQRIQEQERIHSLV